MLVVRRQASYVHRPPGSGAFFEIERCLRGNLTVYLRRIIDQPGAATFNRPDPDERQFHEYDNLSCRRLSISV
jgi:hypothetical protein